ncbi:CinA family protein [Sodalis sp. C49]|uniref:CinA family protein n=1 Tax=unclassified Sodalis (in: enterobacteria) TaxID=2636512 RepID=UPI0039658F28
MNSQLNAAAGALAETLRRDRLILTTAESCTAGLVAMALCAVGGSGDFFTRGFITYTDRAKHEVLRVGWHALETYTAVSEQVVKEMAAGALQVAGEDIALSVSGYAGPEDGPDGTPAGTIWFGWVTPDNKVHAQVKRFSGDCEAVIEQAAVFALVRMRELLQNK